MYQELRKKLISNLETALLKQNRKAEDIEFIKKAFDFAADHHEGQKRRSGEDYIIHPCAVAHLLIKMNCDYEAISAGLLHDVVEDTSAEVTELAKIFNPTVANMVFGVTKLNKLNFKSSEEAQATNFRRMLIETSKDLRVVLVKLADRTHNMQTLHHLKPEKQYRIAKETLDIFAPLANRFGLRNIQVELEDLCFKYLAPNDYAKVKEIVRNKKSLRQEQLEKLSQVIGEVLLKYNIKAEIKGRAKHFWSIYRKLRVKHKNFADDEELKDLQIYDLLGIRILVNEVAECYTVLGIIHDKFRPMANRFKDYIAIPKSNGYQSLHTTVIIPFNKKPLEVQIRTHSMHKIAEYGIAAHWSYKEGAVINPNSAENKQLALIRQLVNLNSDASDDKEYFDGVKDEILKEEVYILSPKGDVVVLPERSTPVDFAYKIHSRVGDTCVGALVNEKMVPLSYKLSSCDMVEILTNKNSHPNLDWLNFVQTHQAKYRIKAWFRKQNKERHISIGEQMIFDRFGKSAGEKLIKSKDFSEAASQLNYKTAEDLIAGLGSGNHSIAQLQTKLDKQKPKDVQKQIEQIKPRKAPARGKEADIPELDGLYYNLAKCCMPIPGEIVVGVVSKGRGIIVHRADCENLNQVNPERIIKLNWNAKSEKVAKKTYPANIKVEVIDRLGIAKDLLGVLADDQVDVLDLKVIRRSQSAAVISLTVQIRGQDHLDSICNALYKFSDVINVERK